MQIRLTTYTASGEVIDRTLPVVPDAFLDVQALDGARFEAVRVQVEEGPPSSICSGRDQNELDDGAGDVLDRWNDIWDRSWNLAAGAAAARLP